MKSRVLPAAAESKTEKKMNSARDCWTLEWHGRMESGRRWRIRARNCRDFMVRDEACSLDVGCFCWVEEASIYSRWKLTFSKKP
ncbi:unnamed protein product [Prunus armeniaca]